MITKPKPSLSLRLMTTSLGSVLASPASSEGAEPGPGAAGAGAVPWLLVKLKSPGPLGGELCSVEAEVGLRPALSGPDSPAGGGTELSTGRRTQWSGGSGEQVGIIHYECSISKPFTQ